MREYDDLFILEGYEEKAHAAGDCYPDCSFCKLACSECGETTVDNKCPECGALKEVL